MKKVLSSIVSVLAALCFNAAVYAADTTTNPPADTNAPAAEKKDESAVTKGAKEAGHATKKAAKKTGHETKKAAKKTGKAVKKGAENVGEKVTPNKDEAPK